MTAADPVPYDRFFSLCAKASRRHGKILSLPVGLQPFEYLRRAYNERYRGGRVLDFGCGVQKPLQSVLGVGSDCYHCCDTDSSGSFTFRSLDDVPDGAAYEIVASNQAFEHLGFEEGIRAGLRLAGCVARGGILQIGVVNPQHPTRQMSNPTHKTPWNYLNLCAVMELGGLEPFYCARCNKTPGPRWYERPLIGMMCRIFRMDWCDTVYAVGRRPAEDD